MLEQLRRQSGSFIIWFIFAIIIAAFVLFFGPQASGELGCGASDNFVVQLDDQNIGVSSWRYAMNSQRSGIPAEQRQTRALDALVGRALLAQAARASGLDVAKDQIVENLKNGTVYFLGMRVPKAALFDDGVFNYERLLQIARQRGLHSIDSLIAEQKMEVLAHAMRSVLVSTRVSREEAEHRFIQQNTTTSASYVKFDKAAYSRGLRLTDGDLDRYIAAHEGEIRSIYEARKAIYKDVKPQIRLRHVMIAKADGKSEDARKQADSLRARLENGDFAAIARESSGDKGSAVKGGDLGWRPADSIGFGSELNRAVATLAKGELSPVIETQNAYHIVRIDDQREGELGFEDVKRELADPKARVYFATEAARRDATAALEKLQGGASLEETFETATSPNPEGNPGQGASTVETVPTAAIAIGESAAAPPAPPAAAEVLELPEIEIEAPALATLGPVSRRGNTLPGIGESAEMASALFESLEIGKLGDRLFENAQGFYIVRLDARTQANLEEFEPAQIRIGDDLEQCLFPLQMVAVTRTVDSLPPQCVALKKGIDNLQTFLFEECSEAAQAGRLRVNSVFLGQQADGFEYRPCGTLDFESALVQVLSLSSNR